MELTLAFSLLQPGLLWLRSFFFNQSSVFGHGPEKIIVKNIGEDGHLLLALRTHHIATIFQCKSELLSHFGIGKEICKFF